LRVSAAVSDITDLMRSEMNKHNVMLRVEIDDELPFVLADAVQLQQVLLNVIINAIEATRTSKERRLLIAAKLNDNQEVLFTVQDSGVGVEDDKLERLFDPFYSTKHNGIGIGLTISRSIIEAHGGRLWATLNDGPGATVQFTLPAEGARVS